MTTSDEHPVSFQAFRVVIADALGVEEAAVSRDASFVRDLHADSIQLVEMMLRMEESGIEIPIESAWEIDTVGDAYELYKRHANPS